MKFESSSAVSVENHGASYEQRALVVSELESFKSVPEVSRNVSSYLTFIKRYKEAKNVNLEEIYKTLPQTLGRDEIHNNFLNSKEHGAFAQFAEYLPLLANKEGRLGKVCRARITKTAKPDDEGNGFVDVVCELGIDREFIKNNPEFSNVRPSVIFGVDITTNPTGYEKKMNTLTTFNLIPGKKASVLCYENAHHVLGVEVPKCILTESEEYLVEVAKNLRSAMSTTGNHLMITNDARFDISYWRYFTDFVDASIDNITTSIETLTQQKYSSPEQKNLQSSYEGVRDFLKAYKKILATDSV